MLKALLISIALAQGLAPVNPVTERIEGTRTFDIGPGYEDTFESVPWGSLQPGDAVNIHYRSTPYVSKVGIRAQGTAAAPVIINGVTDAAGNRPVINCQGARTAPGSAPAFTPNGNPAYGESLGCFVVKRGPNDAYLGPKPSFIQLKNLEIKNTRGSTYTTLAGNTASYGSAACIYFHVAADTLVENVVATGCAFGVFYMAKDGLLSQACERATIRNSRFYNNGVPNSWFEHNAYVQCGGAIVEGSFFGKLVSGSQGSSFKDRSARLIFRNNYVLSNDRAIDMVQSEENDQGIAVLPEYGRDYVYGNTIVNDSAYEAIHYGGDNWDEQEGSATEHVPPVPYRSKLFFWNNNVTHVAPGWRVFAFGLSLRHTTAEVWDNVFNFGPQATNMYWLEYAGDLRLGTNVINGNVIASGRDGSNPVNWTITTGVPVPSDPFLQTLLGNAPPPDPTPDPDPPSPPCTP